MLPISTFLHRAGFTTSTHLASPLYIVGEHCTLAVTIEGDTGAISYQIEIILLLPTLSL